jgi:ribosomal-protein-alanine N-acetyltransferase
MPALKFDIPKIHTSRLILWECAPSTVQSLFSQHTDEEAMAILQMDNEAEYQSLKDKFYERSFHNKRLSFHNFLIYEQPDGPPIGDCCYHIIWRRHKRSEIGYGLWREEYKGKGYMTEVLEAVLKAGLGRLGFTRIEAFTANDNIPSMRLLQRFGFRREGVVPNHYIVNEGEAADQSLSWGLIPENFQTSWPDHPVEALVQSFEYHSLPLSQWNHQAHLCVGLYYLHHYGLQGAQCKMRTGIITYNTAMGVKNTLESGYHETATLFWLNALDAFRAQHQQEPLEKQLAQLLDTPLSNSEYIYHHYSKALLDTVKARGSWVEGDR